MTLSLCIPLIAFQLYFQRNPVCFPMFYLSYKIMYDPYFLNYVNNFPNNFFQEMHKKIHIGLSNALGIDVERGSEVNVFDTEQFVRNIQIPTEVTMCERNVISKKDIESRFPKKIVIEKKDCPICLESIREFERELSCNHTYCPECIDRWFEGNNTCPLCKKIC